MARGRITQDSGFSLVEVMVVVVIIAILASISIPIYFNQREKAWQASSESALRNTATALNSAATSQNGSYVGITIPQLVANEGLKYDVSSIDLVVESASVTNYCLSAYHESWQQTLYWDSAESKPDFVDCRGRY